MCVGAAAPILTAALSMASTVTGFMAQQDQYAAQKAQYEQNYVNSLAAARSEQQQLTLRHLQEQDAAGQKLHLSYVEEAEKRAEAQVYASAAGVSGLSLDNILADIGRKSATNRTTERENYRMTAAQLQAEQDATNITAKNRINSMAPPTPPSPLALGVGLAGSGVRLATAIGDM